MSRYEWPGDRAPARDRRQRRAGYVAGVYGGTNPLLVEEARLAARATARPQVGPGGRHGGPWDPQTIAAGRATANEPLPNQPYLWTPIGPSVAISGDPGSPRVSGRVSSLAVSPDGNRIYAGTAGGGLWYSRDTGSTWAAIGPWSDSPDPQRGGVGATVFSCGALHVVFGQAATPADAEARDEVFVGTGEFLVDSTGMPGHGFGGVGVLHAIGPARWGRLESQWTYHVQIYLDGAAVNRIIPHPEPFTPPTSPTNRWVRLLLATTTGLWDAFLNLTNPAESGALPVADFPPNTGANLPIVTDIAVTTNPGRLWVTETWDRALNPVPPAQLWVRPVPGGAWAPLALPGALLGTGLSLATTAGQAPVYVLGGGASLWRVADPAAPVPVRVAGVPRSFLKSDPGADDTSQSDYDVSVTVHPDNRDVVVIGGGGRSVGGMWCAELFRLNIDTRPATPRATSRFAGARIHADIQALAWSTADPAGRRLWVGCDGGVYLQRIPVTDGIGRGEAHNSGLASVEAGFVASHPRSEGHVLTGTQDNGTLARVGDTVWREAGGGDGGGVVYHPSVGYPPAGTAPAPGAPAPPRRNDHMAVHQFTNSHWHGLGTTVRQPVRRSGKDDGELPAHEQQEEDAARFYSGPAAVMSVGTHPRSRLAVGTNRIWFSENFGRSWHTIPHVDQDPRHGHAAARLNFDVPLNTGASPADDQVVQCRWAGPDTLLVLCERAVLAYVLNTNVDGAAIAGSGPFILDRPGAQLLGPGSAAANRLLPASGSPTDLAVHRLPGPAAIFPSFYVSLTGDPFEPTVAELPPPAPPSAPQPPAPPAPRAERPAKCAPRHQTTPPRPATPAAPPPPPPPPAPLDRPIDPRYETLWWCDQQSQWHPTGLHTAGLGTRAPVYAVVCDPSDPDDVYVATAAGVWKGRLTTTAGGPEWDWRPFSNGLPESNVHDLSIFHDGRLRLLRAAISSMGVWEVDLGDPVHRPRTFLRVHPHDTRRRRVASLVDPTRLNASYRWDASPDVRVRSASRPLGSPSPGEAELIEFYRAESHRRVGDGGRQSDGSAYPSAHRARGGDLAVDVLVHHRDSSELEPSRMGVVVLWQEFPRLVPLSAATRDGQLDAWANLSGAFLPLVETLFDAVVVDPGDAQAVLRAQQGWAAPGARMAGWQVARPAGAGAGVVVGRPQFAFDVRTPRTVTFGLTATGRANSYVVVVACVASRIDPFRAALPVLDNVDQQQLQPLPTTALRNVVRWHHQVAATTVRLTAT